MKCIRCNTELDGEAAFCPKCGMRQASRPEHEDYDYTAFLSYRHRSPDCETATWLQRTIETYRLPAQVAKMNGGAKLGRVFRDADELPATGSLPNSIRDALKRSKYLVVVCSPTTDESTWVNQEIELFASFHGRDRIFAALAEGQSRESIPRSLRQLATVNSTGDYTFTDTEPLAADLRSSSARERKREALRIIASLAGCSYDDLARRDRTRTIKTASGALAVALCAVCAIAIFALKAEQGHRDALVAESAQLAVQSREKLASGDRYGAIEIALRALPESSADTSRPLSEEALEALAEALGVGPSAASPWHPAYSIMLDRPVSVIGGTSMIHRSNATPERIGDIVNCEDCGCFAVSDDDGRITTYDIETGKALAECALPSSAGNGNASKSTPSVLAIESAGDFIVVSREGHPQTLSCFRTRTGELMWEREGIPASSLVASADWSILNACGVNGDGTLTSTSLDMETGSTLASSTVEPERKPTLEHGIRAVIGERVADCIVAVDGQLVHAKTDARDIASASLAHPEIASLDYRDGLAIVASVEEYDGENLELTYSVEAFDANLKKRWERKGTLASEMMVNGDFTSLCLGWPVVSGYTLAGKAVLIRAGRSVAALSLEDGSVLFEQNLSSTALDATPLEFTDDDPYESLITCLDGSMTLRSVAGGIGTTTGDQFRHDFGKQLRWAATLSTRNRIYELAAPADSDATITAYWTDFQTGDETSEKSGQASEYDLDELVAKAHEALGGAS